jgi:N-acetylmuramoyl-L-alanine amidase
LRIPAAFAALWLAGALAAVDASSPAAPVVLIDPGHGGADPGVVLEGFREADYTLALAQDLAKHLAAQGIEARLTRDRDQSLSLSARVELANRLQPVAMVSLHVNAAFQPEAQGARVFVPAEGAVDEPDAPLWEQAARLRARDSRALGTALARSLDLRIARPVQVLKLGLFRGLSVPVCMVETAFASHPESLAGLKSAGQRQALAERLAQGIIRFVEGGHADR